MAAARITHKPKHRKAAKGNRAGGGPDSPSKLGRRPAGAVSKLEDLAPLMALPQNVLVDSVDGLTRATLLSWEKEGLPTRRVEGRKVYPLLDYIKFVHARFVRGGRPATPEGSELLTHKAESEKWQARLRRQRAELQEGKLISRATAEDEMVRLVLEVKAALLSMPAALSRQAANLPAAHVRKIIEGHVTWLCSRLEAGRVPVPQGAAAAIATAISDTKHRRAGRKSKA